LTENNLRTNVENHVNNSSSLDTGALEDGSDLANDNKMEDCPTSSMDHNTSRSKINTTVGEHCVVNSAHGDPTEKSPLLHESRQSPLHASSCSKKSQEDSQQQDSCPNGNFALAWRSGSSLGAELITSQDSDSLMDGTNVLSVDLIPGDKQEDSDSQGSGSQLAPSGASNDDKPSTAKDNVQCTCSNEVPQNGVRDKEVKLSGMVDLPINTTRTFRRKRRPNTSRANYPVNSEVSNMDRGLQPKSKGDTVYSPNSRNEINKSDGDEHLPLVKRARVRMERPALEDATAGEPDHSSDNKEPAKHEDPCYKHTMSAISGKDQSADDLPPSVDASPNINLSLPGEVVNSCNNNNEFQPKVLTLDVEAALPPSKRLHRALEAMSANTCETFGTLPEATKLNEVSLKGCTASTERSPLNNSADALVKSPKSAMAKSPKVSLSAHSSDAPTDQKHITQVVMLNKDALSPVSLDLRNDDRNDNIQKDRVSEEACMDNENVPNLVVHTGIDSNKCEKTPTHSMKLEEPALVSKFDQPLSHEPSGNEPRESVEGSKNAFSITVGVSPEPISQANAVVSYANGTCDPVLHDDTVLAESTVSICDTSGSCLVSKVSCIHSDTSTRIFEA